VINSVTKTVHLSQGCLRQVCGYSSERPNEKYQSDDCYNSATESLPILFQFPKTNSLHCCSGADAQRNVRRCRGDCKNCRHDCKQANPNLPAAKNAGIPSTIGEEPRINKSAVCGLGWRTVGSPATPSAPPSRISRSDEIAIQRPNPTSPTLDAIEVK
jgi:hypothetical protein